MMTEKEYEIKLKNLEREYFEALKKEDCLGAGVIFTSISALMDDRIRDLEEENKRLDEIIKEKKARIKRSF